MAEMLVPEAGTELPTAGLRWVPLRVVTDSGPRGIVAAEVDGAVVPMLVHANAGFTMMLTHGAHRRISGLEVEKNSDYGLGHDLQVSDLGRGEARIGALTVAGHVLRDVRCEVFELPTVHWQGMLGVGWLTDAAPLVDLAGGRLAVPTVTERGDFRERLPSAVRRVPMTYSTSSRSFLVDASLDESATPTQFVASTVAATVLDLDYARRCHLDLVRLDEDEHGPDGAVVANHRTRRPVTIYAAGVPVATITPHVHDIYAYRGARVPLPRSASPGTSARTCC